MVKPARSFNLSKLLIYSYTGFIFLSPALAVTTTDSITFNFQNKNLKSALKSLIIDYDLPIIFPDNIPDDPITASCKSCTQEEAIASLLSTSNLIWEKTRNQFTIINLTEPFKFAVSGRAMDKDTGEPIPFANVFIPQLRIGDISQNDGIFSIKNISMRVCSLTISYIGYESKKLSLHFPKDEKTFHEIFISPKVLATETISITGNTREFMDRSIAPGQISFSPRHISTLPNLGEVDIFRSLQLLPGIQLGIGGTSGLYIRGGTPDQNLILLDGMPLYQTGHLFGFVSGINANTIKDVQVYKGGFPAQFGGRISSVIELTSRNGNSLKPHGALYGNLMSQGLSGGIPLFSRGSWIFNIRSSTTSSFQTELYKSIQNYVSGDDNFNLIGESADGQQTSKYSPNFSYSDITSQVSLMVTPNHRYSLTYTAGLDSIRESRQFFGFADILGDDSSFTKGRTKWENNGTALNISSRWNNEFDSKLIISNYNYSSTYQSQDSVVVNNFYTVTGTVSEENSLLDRSIKWHHNYHGFENHKIGTGIDETFYNIKFYDYKTSGTTSNELEVSQSGFLHSFYIQDHWTPSTNWALQPGLRISYFSEIPEFYTSPRISIINKMFNNITLEYSFGKHYQFIHRLKGKNTTRGTQNMWLLTSEKIPNISSLNSHFGMNWDYLDYSITGEFYFRSMNNLIQFKETTNPIQCIQTTHKEGILLLNQGTGKTKGIEILFRKRRGLLTGWVSYQRNNTLYTFQSLNEGKSFLSDHDKTHELKTVIMTTFAGFNLTANWVYASGHVYTGLENMNIENLRAVISTDRNELRLPPIHHLDISFSKLWFVNMIKIHAGISVYNLYNHNNISHKRYNPYTSDLTMTNVAMFGITSTLFLKISF